MAHTNLPYVHVLQGVLVLVVTAVVWYGSNPNQRFLHGVCCNVKSVLAVPTNSGKQPGVTALHEVGSRGLRSGGEEKRRGKEEGS